jgi:hypothetical protein
VNNIVVAWCGQEAIIYSKNYVLQLTLNTDVGHLVAEREFDGYQKVKSERQRSDPNNVWWG